MNAKRYRPEEMPETLKQGHFEDLTDDIGIYYRTIEVRLSPIRNYNKYWK